MKKLLILLFLLSTNIWAVDKVLMYKSPTCGCCTKWAEHLEKNGFSVESIYTKNIMAPKMLMKVPSHLASCHTAVIDGYFFEGHVPAKSVKRFLKERPNGAIGLSVPAMPTGSPGMEMGDKIDPYDVIVVYKDGKSKVYEHITSLQ